MVLSYKEFKQQLAADIAASRRKAVNTSVEDEYFERLGKEIDRHPIGMLRGRRAGRHPTMLD